jgi:release factor glutamine methyltransferase
MRHEHSRADRGAPTTVGDTVRIAVHTLRQAGIESAARDARMLVAAAAGCSALDLLADPQRRLTGKARASLAAMLARRHAREPVSRILGMRGFYGRDFEISPAVLDPRPETETLVDAALSIAAAEGWTGSPIRILDIGTGSGCLLVTLLAELPQASGLGTDVSGAALAVARANARRHGVASRAHWGQTHSLAGVEGPFDLVVSNPPYIASDEIDLLEPEVRLFEPRTALDGGSDGLMVYREILAGLANGAATAWVLLEIGAGQAPSVAGLIRDTVPTEGCNVLRTYCDLAGQTRCVAWKARI